MRSKRRVRAALRRAVGRLEGLRKPEGRFEGNLEAGILFNAAFIVFARYGGGPLGEAAERRELELARYVVSAQQPSGLFEAFPDGPLSFAATRVALIGLRRVLESNTLLREPGRPQAQRLRAAIASGQRALASARPRTGEHPALRGARFFLSVVDGNRRGNERLFPDWRAPWLPSLALSWFRDSRAWPALDARLFPFITSAALLASLVARDAGRRSLAGRAAAFALEALPFWGARSRAALRALTGQLLDEQDANGAFFYSNAYTELLAAVLEGLLEEHLLGASLEARARAAVAAARHYVATRQERLPSGGYARFLGSDLWDSVGVGLAGLGESRPVVKVALLRDVARLALENQMEDGGWAFACGCRRTDADSTGWTLAYLAHLRRRGLCPALHPALGRGIRRGVDFLVELQSDSGGFGAWGRSALDKRPGTLGELDSIFFDRPTEDVTARALLALGHVRATCAADAAFASELGAERAARVARVCERAWGFLRRQLRADVGLWPGRWTLGFLTGTAFVLAALRYHRFPGLAEVRARAAATVLRAQNADGGFGEPYETDALNRFMPSKESSALHTMAGLIILREGGCRREHPAYRAALGWLLDAQRPDGSWPERSAYSCFSGFYYRYELMTLGAGVELLASELQGRQFTARAWAGPRPEPA